MIGYEWLHISDTFHTRDKSGETCSKCGKLTPNNMSIVYKNKSDIIIECINCYRGTGLYIYTSCFFPYITFDIDSGDNDGKIIYLNYSSNFVHNFQKIGNTIIPGDCDKLGDGIKFRTFQILNGIYRDFILPKPELSPKKYDVEFAFD